MTNQTRSPQKGDRIRDHGDMANQSQDGVVIRGEYTDEWGTWCDIEWEDGRVSRKFIVAHLSRGRRFQFKDEWEQERYERTCQYIQQALDKGDINEAEAESFRAEARYLLNIEEVA